jgi:hypothetical protein
MLLQNRDAFCYALVTDMCGRARYKPSDVIGLAAAKRIAQMRPQASPQTLRPSDPQTLRPSDPQTLRPSDPQTLPSRASPILLHHHPQSGTCPSFNIRETLAKKPAGTAGPVGQIRLLEGTKYRTPTPPQYEVHIDFIEMRLHRDRKMSDTVAGRVCSGICEPLASDYLDRGIFASSEASQLRAAIRN